jgi:hypothetical protein
MLDAFWRAAAYCLHPRMLLWSLLPLLVAGGVVALLGWAYWEPAVAWVRGTLEQWALTVAMLEWLESVGANQLRTLVGPMIVVALAVPLLVVLSLLLVARCRPSGEKETHCTQLVWPSKRRSSRPLAASQRRAVLSSLAVAR